MFTSVSQLTALVLVVVKSAPVCRTVNMPPRPEHDPHIATPLAVFTHWPLVPGAKAPYGNIVSSECNNVPDATKYGGDRASALIRQYVDSGDLWAVDLHRDGSLTGLRVEVIIAQGICRQRVRLNASCICEARAQARQRRAWHCVCISRL